MAVFIEIKYPGGLPACLPACQSVRYSHAPGKASLWSSGWPDWWSSCLSLWLREVVFKARSPLSHRFPSMSWQHLKLLVLQCWEWHPGLSVSWASPLTVSHTLTSMLFSFVFEAGPYGLAKVIPRVRLTPPLPGYHHTQSIINSCCMTSLFFF